MKNTRIVSPDDYDESIDLSGKSRKLKLIKLITIQVISVGFIFLLVHTYLGFYFIALMVTLGILCALTNLWYVTHYSHILIAANVINILYLVVVGTNCYLLVPNSYSYLCWFLVVPLIAGALINLRGLVIYSIIALFILSTLTFVHSYVSYGFSPETIRILDLLNFILVMQLIALMAYSILQQNDEYSRALTDRNVRLKSKQEKLHYLARHDCLTNLPNRLYFNARLQELINSINEKTHSITLFFMDINEFKMVNDKYGHEIGDQLLLAVSRRLKNCLRKNDFIARLSGDEFTAIVVHRKKEKLPEILYDRINKEFYRTFKINQIEIHSPMSIGKSQWPEYAKNIEELLNIADKNMYLHKRTMKIK